MLVLTRRQSESLKIGDDVTVTILALNHNQVRVGISAPRHIEVHREEVYARLHSQQSHEESRAAAAAGSGVP